MFKEDIEWYIKNLECMKNDLYIAAAWKEVPRYNAYTGTTVDTETYCRDEKELERRMKFLNVEIKKWQAQLDFYKEKEHE